MRTRFHRSHVVDAHLATGDRVTVTNSEAASATDGEEYEAHPDCVVVGNSVENLSEDSSSFGNYPFDASTATAFGCKRCRGGYLCHSAPQEKMSRTKKNTTMVCKNRPFGGCLGLSYVACC